LRGKRGFDAFQYAVVLRLIGCLPDEGLELLFSQIVGSTVSYDDRGIFACNRSDFVSDPYRFPQLELR
jgi:hypothetical protein